MVTVHFVLFLFDVSKGNGFCSVSGWNLKESSSFFLVYWGVCAVLGLCVIWFVETAVVDGSLGRNPQDVKFINF